MTVIADFHRFRSQNHEKVWINHKYGNFYLLRQEKIGPLWVVDSTYYYLFNSYDVNYKWMEEYEKPLGPALEFDELTSKTIFGELYKNIKISAIVLTLFDKIESKYKFLYKNTYEALKWMDKHKLWFGGIEKPFRGFLPISELSSTDPF